MAYPKWHKEECNHIQMITDEWDFSILKELNKYNNVPIISMEAIDFLKSFTNFYLEYSYNSYI